MRRNSGVGGELYCSEPLYGIGYVRQHLSPGDINGNSLHSDNSDMVRNMRCIKYCIRRCR